MNDDKELQIQSLKDQKKKRIEYLCKRTFILKRRQFPLKIYYAMTINKSQVQTLNNVANPIDTKF